MDKDDAIVDTSVDTYDTILIDHEDHDLRHTTALHEEDGAKQESIATACSRVTRTKVTWNTQWNRIITTHWIIHELVLLIRLAVPIILTLVLQGLLLMVTLMFVGRINTDEDRSIILDAVVLGLSFVNITGISISTGISTASDTLSAQAYGYGNFKKVGVIFQRGLLICLLLSILISCVWLNTESLLLLVQQNPCIAKYTAQYVQIFILALPPALLYLMLQKYLQTQNIVWPFIVAGFLTNVFNIVVNTVIILGFGFGIRGSATAVVLSYTFQPLVLMLYIRIRKLHKKTWGGWSLECLEGWGQYLRLGIPGMAMICIGWICFEVAAIILGTISKVELALHGITINYVILVYMLPLGISIATSVRVGNELGAGKPKQAKRASYVAFGLIVVEIVVVVCVTQAIKHKMGAIFNAEEEVSDKLVTVIDAASCLMIADHTQGLLSGILRGAGHQFRGALINSAYIIGLPIGIVLAVVLDMGALGMWIGLGVSLYMQAVLLFIVLVCLNWSKEAEKAMNRSRQVYNTNMASSGSDSTNKDTVTVRYQPLDQRDSFSDNLGDSGVNQVGVAYSEQSSEGANIGKQTSSTEDDVQNCDLTLNRDQSMQEPSIADPAHLYGHINIIDSDDTQPSPYYSKLCNLGRRKRRLMIFHTVLFCIAVIMLIGSGIVSRYHPPTGLINGNYSQCTFNNDSL